MHHFLFSLLWFFELQKKETWYANRRNIYLQWDSIVWRHPRWVKLHREEGQRRQRDRSQLSNRPEANAVDKPGIWAIQGRRERKQDLVKWLEAVSDKKRIKSHISKFFYFPTILTTSNFSSPIRTLTKFLIFSNLRFSVVSHQIINSNET